MALKQVIEFVEESPKSYGFNTKSIVSSDASPIPVESTKKRGPGRPSRTNANMYTDDSTIIKANKNNSPEARYEKSYSDTSKMLYGAIAQTDIIYNNVEQELDNFRKNRSYGGRNRMQNISEFMNLQGTLVNTKINAIRELDSIRHKINDLVLKNKQIDKDAQDENSDKAVMDAYYALVNASTYGLPQMTSPLSPATINTGINLSGTQLNGSVISSGPDIVPANVDTTKNIDRSFEEYKNNLTPVQRKMILDNDPNIKTVVVYDQSTGHKYFDVVNVQTGVSIPNVTRPADFLLDSMRIDARAGIAVNSNINQSFPLVIVGSRAIDEI